MDKNYILYKKIRRAKIVIGVIGMLFIIGLFGVIFTGFYKISRGAYVHFPFNGVYATLRTPISDAEGNENIIMYTYNMLWVNETYGYHYGTLDSNNLIIYNTHYHKVVLNYTLDKENYVIGFIAPINPFNNYNENAILVQYSNVDPSQKNTEKTYSGTQYYYNETGIYETYIFRLIDKSTTEIINITHKIKSKIRDIINFYSPPDDIYPDFAVITSNQTAFGDIYRIYNIYINGTIAWESGNIGNFGNANTLLSYNNRVILFGDLNMIYLIDSVTGKNIRNITLSPEYGLLLGLYRAPDINHDGYPEIVLEYRKLGEYNKIYLVYFDIITEQILGGTYGPLKIPELYRIPYPEINGKPLSNTPQLFIQPDYDNRQIVYIQIGDSIKEIGQFEADFGYFPEKTWNYISITKNRGTYVHLVSEKNDKLYIFNISSIDGGYSITSRVYTGEFSGELIVGDILEGHPGLDIINLYFYDKTIKIINLDEMKIPYYMLSPQNTYLFISFLILLIISTVLIFVKRKALGEIISSGTILPKKRNGEEGETHRSLLGLKGLQRANIILLAIMIIASISLFYFVFFQSETPIYADPTYLAIRNIYIITAAIYVTMTVIVILYNIFSVPSAMLLIKLQSAIYRKILSRFRRYRPIVLKMEYAEKHSPVIIITRSLFALFISITIGLQIFNILGTESILTAEGDINPLWISQFELYGVLPMIITYLILSILVPGTWLLDDAGVVYFEEPVDVNAPQDISKISDWFLRWLKGLFGFTAIVNYIMLFQNLQNSQIIDTSSDTITEIFIVVMIIGFNLILMPLIVGMFYMLAGNISIIGDLKYNKEKLLRKMKAAGYDITAYDLKDLFKNEKNKHKTEKE